MKRGIVLEYNEKFVIFLTEDGYFLKDHKKKRNMNLEKK
ncbi:anti-sigma factor domain-containing protein [Metabacillus endolithicus]